MTKQIEAPGKNLRSMGLQKLLALGALVILYVFFCVFGSNFASGSTLVSILDSTYYVAFMAFGITFVIITGGIDLSIGTNMMCSALIGGYLYSAVGLNIWLCLVVIVIISTLFGFVNGLLVSRLKLPPFIATLGMMMMTRVLAPLSPTYRPSVFPPVLRMMDFTRPSSIKRLLPNCSPAGFPAGCSTWVFSSWLLFSC